MIGVDDGGGNGAADGGVVIGVGVNYREVGW